MVDFVDKSFQRIQASKSRYTGRVDYGYIHGWQDITPKTNIITNEFLSAVRAKRGSEWLPKHLSEHPKPAEISCYPIHHYHVGQIPNYGGHIPGAIFRFGRTYGQDTINAKRWLRGDHRPN